MALQLEREQKKAEKVWRRVISILLLLLVVIFPFVVSWAYSYEISLVDNLLANLHMQPSGTVQGYQDTLKHVASHLYLNPSNPPILHNSLCQPPPSSFRVVFIFGFHACQQTSSTPNFSSASSLHQLFS